MALNNTLQRKFFIHFAFTLLCITSSFAQQFNELDDTQTIQSSALSTLTCCQDTNSNFRVSFTNNGFINNANFIALSVSRHLEDNKESIFVREINKVINLPIGWVPNIYEVAIENLTRRIATRDINRNLETIKSTFRSRIFERNQTRSKTLENLALLSYRNNELNEPGKFFSSGNLALEGSTATPLRNLTSIPQVSSLSNAQNQLFSTNEWQMQHDNGILGFASNFDSFRDDFSRDIDRIRERHESFFNRKNTRDQYVLLELYLNLINRSSNVVRVPLQAPREFLDLAPPSFADLKDAIEREAPSESSSIFHPRNNSRTPQEIQDIINDLVEGVHDDIFGRHLTINLTNINEIRNNSGLHTAVLNYFKANRYTQVSHDCVNYLLNQLSSFQNFDPDTNLYRAASTPLEQTPSAPNRALETRLSNTARAQGFTNFSNVLTEALKNNRAPDFEGFIIRRILNANGFNNIDPLITNETLGRTFAFGPGNNSIRINYENNLGSNYLNHNISLESLLRNSIFNALNRRLNLNNVLVPLFFNHPEVGIAMHQSIFANNNSPNYINLLNELNSVIREEMLAGFSAPGDGVFGSTARRNLSGHFTLEIERLRIEHPEWTNLRVISQAVLNLLADGLDVLALTQAINPQDTCRETITWVLDKDADGYHRSGSERQECSNWRDQSSFIDDYIKISESIAEDCDDNDSSKNVDCTQEEKDPCEENRKLLENPAFNSRFRALSNKTNLKEESGFSLNNNNQIIDLNVNPNSGGHELQLPSGPQVRGSVHVHLDPFETGKVDALGQEQIIRPIKIFSPRDVLTFLQLVKNTDNSNIIANPEDAFSGLVTSNNNYFLRFSGNVSEINSVNLNPSRQEIRVLDNKFVSLVNKLGLEKGFLNFLRNEFNLRGIKLFKVKRSDLNNIKLQERSLNSNGRRVEKRDC